MTSHLPVLFYSQWYEYKIKQYFLTFQLSEFETVRLWDLLSAASVAAFGFRITSSSSQWLSEMTVYALCPLVGPPSNEENAHD